MPLENSFSQTWAQIRDRLLAEGMQPLLQLLAWAGLIFLLVQLIRVAVAKARNRPSPGGLRWAFLVALIAVTPIAAINLGTGLADAFVKFVAQILSPLLPE